MEGAFNLGIGETIEALEGIRICAHEEHQSRGLWVWLGAALLPFFQRAFVDAQLAGEDGAGASQPSARVANQLGVNLWQRGRLHSVSAQRELAFAVALHRRDALDQFVEHFSFGH